MYPVVDNFTYLGVKFNFNGRFVKEKQLKYSNGCRAMFSLNTQGKNVSPTHRHPAAAIPHACDPSSYVRGRSVGN